MEQPLFPGRLGVQQRVLPEYRAAFFEALAQACAGGLRVFAGQPLPMEGIKPAARLEGAELVPAHNRHLFNPSSPFYVCWQGGFLDWLESWQPEALVVEANPRYPTTRQALRWMQRRGRRVIGWGLGAPPLGGRLASLRNRQRLAFLRSLDGLVAYSQRGAQEYRALGIPPERVFVAPNAVSPRPVAPPPPRLPQFQGRPVVLFVGRLQGRKRLDLLLQACAALPANMQPRLLIVGDGPARAEFEALARQVYPSAEFAGAQHGAALAPFFAQADLFALPGTGGLAVQEAMAQGLPVIVARGDGTQDDLVRPQNGWQIPSDELPALTEALRRALSDPVRLRQMGAESYRIAAEEVNLEKMVAVFLQALQRQV